MERRTLLCGMLAAGTMVTAGCAGGGEVAHEVRRQVAVERGGYWLSRLPSVDGNGAISSSIRADRRFDLYVFTRRRDLDAYETYHEGDEPDRTPTGHDRFSGIAGSGDESDRFVLTTKDDGSRESYGAESEWYFVVDHSAFGHGVPPGEHADALRAFVDLQIIDHRYSF